jgi:hypothetical protein
MTFQMVYWKLYLVEYWGGTNSPFRHIDHYCFIGYASGSLRSTAKDMAIFLDSMLRNYGQATRVKQHLGVPRGLIQTIVTLV